jgi:hypothetical protein
MNVSRSAAASPSRYIALGDSISIDIYPAADASLRFPDKASTDRLGAASLLARNDDSLWPEFRGRDLRIPFDNFTADGATTHTLLAQVERIQRSDEPLDREAKTSAGICASRSSSRARAARAKCGECGSK